MSEIILCIINPIPGADRVYENSGIFVPEFSLQNYIPSSFGGAVWP